MRKGLFAVPRLISVFLLLHWLYKGEERRTVVTLPKWEGLKRPPFPFEESKVTKTEKKNAAKRRYRKTMDFFLQITPPTATAQEKQVTVVNGRPVFYDPAPVKKARNLLSAQLAAYRPPRPLEGPLALSTVWLFPKGKSHKHGEWRVTKPDTDNLQKLLKDCMTRCGFWRDDAQVVRESVEKRWSDEPTGIYIEVTPLEAGS